MSALIRSNDTQSAPLARPINPFLPMDGADAYRMAQTLALSRFVPDGLVGKDHNQTVANVFAVMAVAHEMGVNPVILLQHAHVVHGKVGYSAQYMIARVNSSGKLNGGMWFTSVGEGSDLAVTAHAKRADGVTVSETVTMAQAVKAGWVKNNAKYNEIPRQMLSYRAATNLIRLYCPEVMFGVTREELVDELAANDGQFPMIEGEVVSTAETRAAAKAEVVKEGPGKAEIFAAAAAAGSRQKAIDYLAQFVGSAVTNEEARAFVAEKFPKAKKDDLTTKQNELFSSLSGRLAAGEIGESDAWEEIEGSGFWAPEECGPVFAKVKGAAAAEPGSEG